MIFLKFQLNIGNAELHVLNDEIGNILPCVLIFKEFDPCMHLIIM